MTVLADVLETLSSSREVVDAVTAAIRGGELSPGDALPSVRSIAQASNLSPGTVALAFRILRDRGIITTAHGRRARVSMQPVSQRSMELRVPDTAINLAVVGPDPDLLPDVNAVLARAPFRTTLYDTENVEPQFRAVLTDQFAADGIPGELTVTNGALDALERIFRTHLTPGDAVVVEDPSWSSALGLLRLLNLTVVGAEVDDRGITEEALHAALASRRISAVLITPRAQNPFGSALDAERAAGLRRILDAHPHVLVIEDDHAGHLSDGPALTLTQGREHFAVIRSMNKALGPDLRVAAMMSDEATADAVQRRMLLGPGWVPHFVQRVAASLLEDADAVAAVHHAREVYALRRESFLAALERRGIPAHGRSGLNVAIPVPDETATVSRLLLQGWAVRAGSYFRVDTEPFIRVCTATLVPSQGEALAEAIADVLTPRRRVVSP